MTLPRLLRTIFTAAGGFLFSALLFSQIITLPGLAEPEFPEAAARQIISVREEGWNAEGLQYIREILFRPDGQMESETYFNPDGTQGSQILYMYDLQGRLERKEFHHPDARIPDAENYLWDDRNRLVSVARAYTTGMYGWRFEYTYNEAGRLIRAAKIDRYWKDVVVWTKEFVYDADGRITSSTGGGLDENIRWRDEYLYDSAGLLSEQLKYDASGDLISHVFYGRDHRGRINREWQGLPGGGRTGELHYYYRDDSRGNWREKHVGRASMAGGSRYFLPASWYLRSFEYREN